MKSKKELLDKITSYFQSGGLFNPEMMEHDKVRQLIMDCQEYLKNQQDSEGSNNPVQVMK